MARPSPSVTFCMARYDVLPEGKDSATILKFLVLRFAVPCAAGKKNCELLGSNAVTQTKELGHSQHRNSLARGRR
jgi:hypothetical protein